LRCLNINGTEINNRAVYPIAPTNVALNGPGQIQNKQGAVTTVAAAATSVYRFTSVPSGARITGLMLRNAALAGVTAVDFGLAEQVAPGTVPGTPVTYANSTAANQFCFAQGSTLAAANNAGTNLLTLLTATKRVWEVAGFTADPARAFDVVATVTTGAAVGGQIVLNVDYIAAGT
jgi:hypothetical protein